MKALNKKTAGVAVALILFIGIIGFVFLNRQPAEAQRMEIQPESFRQVVTATGQMTGSHVQLQSEVTARVTQIPVSEGDFVQAGQLLVQLDDSDLQLQLRQREAELAVARAQHRRVSESRLPEAQDELASLLLEKENLERELQLEKETLERRLNRQRALYEQGALALEPLEETENEMALLEESMAELDLMALRIASAERAVRLNSPGGSEASESAALLAQSQVQVETLQEELERFQLVSPVSGRVLERPIELGELAQSGNVLLTISREGSLVAQVEIDERNIGLLEVGQEATVWPEAYPSREVAATVDKISPRVNTDTGTVMVQLKLESEEDFLIQDLTIQAEIQVRELENALLLPASYLKSREPFTVLVEVDNSTEERTLPRTEIVGLEKILVLEGLKVGDVVVQP